MDAEAVARVIPLSDEELTSEVQRLARSERESTAALVAHLAEFDARRLWLGAGFPSLFMYCTEVLRLSEHEAYNRIEVARLGRRFPRVLALVGKGALNLTTARLLAPHLTNENQERLLAETSDKSKREVEEILVRYFPRPDVPPSVRRVPTPRSVPASSTAVWSPPPASVSVMTPAGSVTGDSGPASVGAEEGGRSAGPACGTAADDTRRARRQSVRPLAADRYEIRFTATAQTCEKLRVAKDLLRHAVPDGDIGAVVDRALTVLLEDLARKKFAATPRPRPNQEQAADTKKGDSRHVPAPVKRAVWLRDGGRCAFVGKGGHRCKERGFLEFHHLRPYAVGGLATTDNIQIRCRAHNAHEADLLYGRPENETAINGGLPAANSAVANSFRNELVSDSGMRRAPLGGRRERGA